MIDTFLDMLQAFVWYSGFGAFLLCLIAILEEQIRIRLRELKDRNQV
jgi:hypothetical protein